MRISLRSFLILLTVFATFVGWRCNQRRSISAAAKKVEELSGVLSYRWQKPIVAGASAMVTPAWQRQLERTVTLPDGTQETRTYQAGYTVWAGVSVEEVTLNETVHPEVHVTGFVFGTHDDVAVDVVAVKPEEVTEELVNELQKLTGLKTVLLQVHRQYYRVMVANWAPPEWRDEELAKLSKPTKDATALLASKLANVTIASGIADSR